MASQSITHSSQIENIRLEQGISQAKESDVKERNGRSYRPISFGMRGSDKGMTGLLVCACAVSITCFIAGGIMWGTCSDPDTNGCNESVLRAGKACVFTGVGSVTISLIACVGYALIDSCR